MRFLVDERLPPSLAEQLSAAGHDAISVVGLGLAGAFRHRRIGSRARTGPGLVSADTDFGELLARSYDRQPSLVLFRGDEVDPKALALILLTNLGPVEEPLDAGAIIVVLDDCIRVRHLPLG